MASSPSASSAVRDCSCEGLFQEHLCRLGDTVEPASLFVPGIVEFRVCVVLSNLELCVCEVV